MLSRQRTLSYALALTALLAGSRANPATAQTYTDLRYFTVPGCIAVDTRAAVGPFSLNEIRTYTVTGSASLAGQGGSATGCGLPAFSSTVAQIQAVNLNVVAINPSATGFFEIWPSDLSTSISLLDFPGSAVTSTNVVVPVNQTSGTTGDIKIQYNGSSGHLLIAVTGYYAKPQQTVYVHSVPGNPTAGGTALVNAFSSLAALTGGIAPSSTRQYTVQLDPGIYDIGGASLTLLSYVDLVGAGQEATIIRNTGYTTGQMNGTLKAVSLTAVEIRDLQVQSSVTSGGDDAIAVYAASTPLSVRNVTVVTTHNGSGAGFGVRSVGSSATFDLMTVRVSGSTSGALYGISLDGDVNNFPFVRRTTVNASGTSATQIEGVYVLESASPTLRDVESQASGGSAASGLFADYANAGGSLNTVTVFDSNFKASGATSNYGVRVTGTSNTFVIDQSKAVASTGTSYGLNDNGTSNTYTINRTELTGGTGSVQLAAGNSFSAGASLLSGGVTATTPKCIDSYNGAYTALSAACL